MTDEQWQKLIDVVDGAVQTPPLAAFIIDSPWLPGWAGMSILDYFTSEERWFEANMRAIEEFPEVVFLPGFWSEFGMCTEPSAFGARMVWGENEFPTPVKLSGGAADIAAVGTPNPEKDGLCPFVLKRLEHFEGQMSEHGHKVRFAVARGPLNIASFLMGTTEFLMELKTEPDAADRLLAVVTDFIVAWLQLQKRRFPSIDGIFLLDDIVGFVGPEDFERFARTYLTKTFAAFDARIRMFHNDAQGLVCAPSLRSMGVDIFNFSHNHSMEEMRTLVGEEVVLFGNIPPRDILASGSVSDVAESVGSLLGSVADIGRVIISCGGGMPPGVPSANIRAFLTAAGY